MFPSHFSWCRWVDWVREKKFPVPSSAEFAERFFKRSNIGTKLNKSAVKLAEWLGAVWKSCLTSRFWKNQASASTERRFAFRDVDQTQSAVDIALLLSSLSGTKRSRKLWIQFPASVIREVVRMSQSIYRLPGSVIRQLRHKSDILGESSNHRKWTK